MHRSLVVVAAVVEYVTPASFRLLARLHLVSASAAEEAGVVERMVLHESLLLLLKHAALAEEAVVAPVAQSVLQKCRSSLEFLEEQ
mmetsp:Transcript_6104/g.13019  ORF Transcript_6104/g.13019 Transcript_6104/m.13019 type:complete len:86 (-) Transcript_6104:1891-2148(-)